MGLVDPHLPPVVHHCFGQTCWEQPSANQGLQVDIWKCGSSLQTQLTESDNTCMCTCTTRELYISIYMPYIHTNVYTAASWCDHDYIHSDDHTHCLLYFLSCI